MRLPGRALSFALGALLFAFLALPIKANAQVISGTPGTPVTVPAIGATGLAVMLTSPVPFAVTSLTLTSTAAATCQLYNASTTAGIVFGATTYVTTPIAVAANTTTSVTWNNGISAKAFTNGVVIGCTTTLNGIGVPAANAVSAMLTYH